MTTAPLPIFPPDPPPAEPLHLRPAGLGWRAAAAAIDVALLVVLVLGVAGLYNNDPVRMLNGILGAPLRILRQIAGLFASYWFGARGGYYRILFYVPIAYVLLDCLPWGTFGKLALGLRLVRRRDGQPADLSRRLARAALIYAPLWFGAYTAFDAVGDDRNAFALAAALHCGLGILCAVSFLSAAAPGHRALHDRATGTHLTRDRSGHTPVGFAPVLQNDSFNQRA